MNAARVRGKITGSACVSPEATLVYANSVNSVDCGTNVSDSSVLLRTESFSTICSETSFVQNSTQHQKFYEQTNPKVHNFRILNAAEANQQWQLKKQNRTIHKPVLMCFICKLSFSYNKSFTLHANKEHGIDLKDLERFLLLQRKFSSAIIQSNMEENPQISFLEPDNEIGDAITAEPRQLIKVQTNTGGSLAKINSEDSSKTSLQANLDENSGDTYFPVFEKSLIRKECQTPSKSGVTLFETDNFNQDNTFVGKPINQPIKNKGNAFEKSVQQSSEENEIVKCFRKDTSSSSAFQTSASLLLLSSEENSNNVQVISEIIQQQILSASNKNNSQPFPVGRYCSLLQNICPIHKADKSDNCKNCEMADILKLFKEDINSLTSVKCGLPKYGLLAIANRQTNTPKNYPKSISNSNNGNVVQANASSLTIGACSDHIIGRPMGSECSKCEMILSNARLSSQASSRNSCKTLKCPQCNWHYKYQETLEIHMREKHPNGEPACVYCLAGQQHPRLARGESYSCGYKPYRCEICNYSTTTKGNLSIHMQSDKHLNNVHELNTSQSIAVANTNALPKLDTNISYHSNRHDSSLYSSAICDHKENLSITNDFYAKNEIKECLIRDMSTNTAITFRCDLCSYETKIASSLRLHMTSEKHVLNLSVLQNNIKKMQAVTFLQNQQEYSSSLMDGFNLTNNQPRFMQYINQEAEIKKLDSGDACLSNTSLNEGASYPPYKNSHNISTKESWPSTLLSCLVCRNFDTDSFDELIKHSACHSPVRVVSNFLPIIENEASTNIHFTDIKAHGKKMYLCKTCQYTTESRSKLEDHVQLEKHKLETTDSVGESGLVFDNAKKLYEETINQRGIKCNSCDFETSNLTVLKSHLEQTLHLKMKTIFETIREMIISNKNICKCADNNWLKQTFDKAETYNSEFKYISLHCHACNEVIISWREMINHLNTADGETHNTLLEHEISSIFKLCRNYPKEEPCNLPNDTQLCNAMGFICMKCKFTSLSRTIVELHVQAHHTNSSIADIAAVPLSTHLPLPMPNTVNPMGDDIHSSLGLMYPEKMPTLPFLKYLLDHKDDLLHLKTDPINAVQSSINRRFTKVGTYNDNVQCPLCQEFLPAVDILETHLINEHCVNKNSLDRLLYLLQSAYLNDCAMLPSLALNNKIDVKTEKESLNNPLSMRGKIHQLLRCQICGSSFKQEQQLLFHAQKMEHCILTDGEYLCLASNTPEYQCCARFKSMPAMFEHYSEVHVNIVISEKHSYKYRCTLCSLAFKTREKLETHTLYHSMRDLTKCELCLKHFRSSKALKNHLQQSHNQGMMEYEVMLNAVASDKANENPSESVTPEQATNELSLNYSNDNINFKPKTTRNISEAARAQPLNKSPSLRTMSKMPVVAADKKAESDVINPIDIINMIQLNRLMSLSLAPQLVLERVLKTDGTYNIHQLNQDSLIMETKPLLYDAATTSDHSSEKTAAKNNETLSQQGMSTMKRARTRITDAQLKILRSHFDINNSPSEESIASMSQKANLPVKVVKHWFRNTLFKERQKNKDSPYNFSIPPSTTFDFEEYERASQPCVPVIDSHGSTKSSCSSATLPDTITKHCETHPTDETVNSKATGNSSTFLQTDILSASKRNTNKCIENGSDSIISTAFPSSHHTPTNILDAPHESNYSIEHNAFLDHNYKLNTSANSAYIEFETTADKNISDLTCGSHTSSNASGSNVGLSISDFYNHQLESLASTQLSPIRHLQSETTSAVEKSNSDHLGGLSPNSSTSSKPMEKNTRQPLYDNNLSLSNTSPSAGKRANRTRFTDYQIKVLQEFFENNSYPKDSDLEYLSKLLLLSPRVIVVWFQNARQKQRKIYENQPSNALVETEDKKNSISYGCRRCNIAFHRYYELIRHQKNSCAPENSKKKNVRGKISIPKVNGNADDSNSSVEATNYSAGSSTKPYNCIIGTSTRTRTDYPTQMDQSCITSANDYDGCHDFVTGGKKTYMEMYTFVLLLEELKVASVVTHSLKWAINVIVCRPERVKSSNKRKSNAQRRQETCKKALKVGVSVECRQSVEE